MTEDFKDSIDRIAGNICARGLASPAIFILELHKPLVGVLREITLVSSPIFSALFGGEYKKLIGGILESPDRVEELILRIEEMSRAEPGD